MPKNKSAKRNKQRQKQKYNNRVDAVGRLSEEIGIETPRGNTLGRMGIIVEDMGLSHISVLMSESINEVCSNYLWNDLCVFVYNDAQTCSTLLCPMHKITELTPKFDIIISTCIEGCMEAASKQAKQIIYYVFDLDWCDKTHISYEDIYSTVHRDDVVVMTRNTDYAEVIRDQFSVDPIVIEEDCNIGLIVQRSRQCVRQPT